MRVCLSCDVLWVAERHECVTTETRPLDRRGQLGEFEQDRNTESELESNTDSHSA